MPRDRLTPGLLLAMAFVVGTGRAFEQPSLQSVLPNIVPSDLLPRAIAGSSSASQTAVIAGPALGGILIEISPTLVFAVCAALWLSAGLVTLGIAMEAKLPERAPLDLKSMFSGLTFMMGQKIVLGAVLLDLFAVVLGNPTAVLPIFARDIYLAGPLGFGMLRAAPAAGADRHGAGAGALAYYRSRRPPHVRNRDDLRRGDNSFRPDAELLMALAALLVLGASDTISVVIRQTMVQLRTPDHMRGRVYAVNSMVTNTSNQLGISAPARRPRCSAPYPRCCSAASAPSRWS